jgi:hypothetical protein
MLRPEVLEKELIPGLERIVQESQGRLKGFYLWPEHRMDGEDKLFEGGRRRYPKRLKEYNY